MRQPKRLWSYVWVCVLVALVFMAVSGKAQTQTAVSVAGAQNLGSVAVGSPSPATQTYTVTFASNTSIQAPLVVTQGAPNLDFTDAGTGSCTANGTGYSYSAGSTCTVVVNFAPKYPGLRMGAVELLDTSGNLLSTTLIYGTGNGPLVTFTPGTITTVAGNGVQGYDASQDNGTTAATNAELTYPTGVAVDGAGNLYIADGSERVRKVTASTGYISTVAGIGPTNYGIPIADSGTTAATSAAVDPVAVAVDGAGNFYFADGRFPRVRKVTIATGFISTVAGNGMILGPNGTQDTGIVAATDVAINTSVGLAVDAAGNVYIADFIDSRVRKVSAATGLISTVAGNGNQGYDPTQDTGTTLASSAIVSRPSALALDGAGNLYIADLTGRIRKVNASTGFISTVAGGGSVGYDPSQDNGTTPATDVALYNPDGLALDGAGNLYIADAYDERILRVAASTGFITTIIGSGVYCRPDTTALCGDGGPATAAQITQPGTLALDGTGNLYFVTTDERIRKVSATAAPLSFAATSPGATSSDSPETLVINNIGSAPLVFVNPLAGNNPSVSSGFTIANSSSCPQLTSNSGAGTLGSGASCTDHISFMPTVLGSNSGQLVFTDNTLNVSPSTQFVSLSGTAAYPIPTVTGLSPVSGKPQGGTIVTITGTGFTSTSAVTFGSVAAASFAVVNDATIQAVTPAESAGAVYVTVSNPGYTSANSVQYTFKPAQVKPTVSWTSPVAIPYGQALSSTQLNATASVAGSFVYSPSAGAVLQVGTQTLSVTFTPSDTADYLPVTTTVLLVVNKATTSTTLAVTTTQTVTGTTATLTATVHPQIGGTPTGTITYLNGTTTLGSAPVGTPFTTAVLPVGTDSLSASYSGDSNFGASTSAKTSVISIPPTPVTLITPLSKVFYPLSSVALTVIVPLKNLQLISGTVTLYDGSAVIGTYPLPLGGILVAVTPRLSLGTHSLRAVYGGNGQYPPGESALVAVTVSPL